MRAVLGVAALVAATSAGNRCCAASVKAGTLTTVTVDAPLYDTRLAAAGGCDPSGCSGDKTRDGDLTTLGSRWSCKSGLGTVDSTCSITYSFAGLQTVDSLNIAMYKGDTRTRTMDVYVDGVVQTTWTSSGTTTGFENIELGVSGHAVELRGVLADSEWLSILEVEILVDDGIVGGDGDTDGDALEVEAGTLATVTAAAVLYDTRLSSSNGCDPEGCTADLTRDGDVSDASRWSCAPSLGGTCSISYDLGAVRDLSQLRLAMYKGATRMRTVDISVDGIFAVTWTSSGTTSDFETIDMSGYAGQDITITGVLDDSEWISIVETEIMVLSDGIAPPPSPTTTTPAPVLAPVGAPTPWPTVATPEQLFSSTEVGLEGTTVTVAATMFDPNFSADNGCDPSGCTAALTRDGDLADASRWSCKPSLGGDDDLCAISYDLGAEYGIAFLYLAMYKGAERQRTVQVYVDGIPITTWTSSGTTDGFEIMILPSGTAGTVVQLRGVLDESEWISIIETEIFVWPQNDATPPPVPTPTPAPAPVQPTAPPTSAPVGVLTPVGPLPLVRGREPVADRYAVKDGDLSTAWTCAGDASEPDEDGIIRHDCNLYFSLIHYRHIKQVKIALSDGAERPVDMWIDGSNSDTGQKFVTSSGTTDGLETYEIDATTPRILISAVFSGSGQSISISEVEFVEEVVEGEVLLDSYGFPRTDDNLLGNESTSDGFDFTSDSDRISDRLLYMRFAGYFTVTEMQLKFPAGDTYKFGLWIYNEADGTHEPYVIVTDLESADAEGWQSFDLTSYADKPVTHIAIIMTGTGSGAPVFKLLDARILGTKIDHPANTFYVASTLLEEWGGEGYPDFVGTGTGDQTAINGAICAVKKASYDGVDCVGGDDAATGTVELSFGAWYVDGNIIMKSGVLLKGRFTDDDFPYSTDIVLEEGAAGNTDIDAIIVMDDISDAWLEDLWILGLYDPETSNNSPAVSGLGSTGISVVNSHNITIEYAWIVNLDGDAVVVRNSNIVNIDAGKYDDELKPWAIGENRGTGLIVDSSNSVWVRRHNMYDNGVAGIHITGSNNFTFEATIRASGEEEGEGRVGSIDGQQPIEVIIESSSLVKFQDMRVLSANDPVMTVSDSTAVSFTNCGFSSVETGTCIIQTDDPSVVTIDAEEDELVLEGTCYVKV